MRELRVPYQVVPNPESTRSKILLESARLFAIRGYSTVSVRDVALATGITPGAIYTHFSSKQEILDTIMERSAKELHEFYALLDRLSDRAQSLEEILKNIFAEPMELTNAFSYYSLWCATCTQFEFESARHVYYDIFLIEGKAAMKRQLDTAIARGLSAPFETESVASLISSSIIMMISISVGHVMDKYADFDVKKWYGKQIDHILRVAELSRISAEMDRDIG